MDRVLECFLRVLASPFCSCERGTLGLSVNAMPQAAGGHGWPEGSAAGTRNNGETPSPSAPSPHRLPPEQLRLLVRRLALARLRLLHPSLFRAALSAPSLLFGLAAAELNRWSRPTENFLLQSLIVLEVVILVVVLMMMIGVLHELKQKVVVQHIRTQ